MSVRTLDAELGEALYKYINGSLEVLPDKLKTREGLSRAIVYLQKKYGLLPDKVIEMLRARKKHTISPQPEHIAVNTPHVSNAGETSGIWKQRLELRDYQVEALDSWHKNGMRGIVVLPTGTGKTYLAIKAIGDELENGGAVAVIVPTIALAYQWRDKIADYLRVEPALYYGYVKNLGKVTVFVVNSAYMNLDALSNFSLIVVDEIHHLSAPSWKRIIDATQGKKVLGLTATPEGAVLPVVYTMSVGGARTRNAVVEVDIIPVYASLNEDESLEYNAIEEKMRAVMEDLKHAEAWGDKKKAEWLNKQYVILANRRKQLMSNIEDKRMKVVEIARKHPNEKILVFTESVEGAEKLVEELNKNGIPAESYHSRKPKRIRETLLKDWGNKFRVLVAVRSLDEGIDVPDASVAIMVASGKTIRQLTQRLGRILRPAPGKTKAYMYVVLGENTYEKSILSQLKNITFSPQIQNS
ncbi:MAG: DEAD/DEAH box helicase [Thermofilum sp.]|jgi:superfamily II DNA or RNA helicase|uniref:DEAD/DEAH box helicase n=1 Tax=Thermofilum sp. TaxID=1961369 RepID=UPI002588AAD5|nr:DEAD/DEAH box helicase [Thermofilum sp.]MCI4409182.1 DEAD/DEAH box helicase [Thermofilum sp.]